jgi:hypothetical protein
MLVAAWLAVTAAVGAYAARIAQRCRLGRRGTASQPRARAARAGERRASEQAASPAGGHDRHPSSKPVGPAAVPALSQARFGAPPTLATVLVSYEIDALASQFADYGGFITALISHPQHAQLHHSAWVIRTFDSVQRVTGELESFLRPEGRLFVARIGREVAWTEVTCGSSWLYENLWP